MVGHHHAVGMAGGTHALHVGHRGRAGEADTPPRRVGAPAQVHVLGVHEVGLVEATELLQRAPPGEEAGTRDPARPDHGVAFGGAGVVAPREGVLGVEQCEQRVPRGVA